LSFICFAFRQQLAFLIGAFGASAGIVFTNPSSSVAQPRNLIGGSLIGALCGFVVRLTIDPYEHSTASIVAVVLSVVLMQFTETLHPPGVATALIAITNQPPLPWSNFLFIFMPTLTGALILLIVALIVNNLAPKRTYPTFWW
jgi:CBS-domain-containing membrane protein